MGVAPSFGEAAPQSVGVLRPPRSGSLAALTSAKVRGWPILKRSLPGGRIWCDASRDFTCWTRLLEENRMTFTGVNLWPVLVAAIATMIVGFPWYWPDAGCSALDGGDRLRPGRREESKSTGAYLLIHPSIHKSPKGPKRPYSVAMLPIRPATRSTRCSTHQVSSSPAIFSVATGSQ